MDLYELGRQTGKAFPTGGYALGRKAARRVARALEQISETHRRLESRVWNPMPPAVEWVLDNVYLAFREGKAAQKELKKSRYLRKRGPTSYLEQAAACIVKEIPELQQEGLLQFLRGVQDEVPFTEEELTFLVPALCAALCDRLANLCHEVEKEPCEDGLADQAEALFGGLRAITTLNLGPALERASVVDQILRQDPGGAYPLMSEETRAGYRYQVCRLARKHGIPEQKVAQRVLGLSKKGEGKKAHIGWYLFQEPLGKKEKKPSGALYVASILIPTFMLALWLGFTLQSPTLFLLLLLPASDLMKNLVDFLVMQTVPPRPVHSMELKDGIPEEGKTLCVIAGLLTSGESGSSYGGLLERYLLANRDSGKNLQFGLLADLPDRGSLMGPRELEWVEAAAKVIALLNEKYGGGFYLFFRAPIFQKSDERYVGWERKRGALIELTRLLKDKKTDLSVWAGDKKALMGTRYVITLDSDTALNVGSARKLIGAMLHPLNRPVIDLEQKIVVEGYGLLQPRVGVDLKAANRSQFSRIFAGQGGIDPYGGACSDVYHDLFDRGTYTGKGIFDVDAFYQCLEGRFPREQVLSHDLIEGAYLHAGLLEQVELTDGYPYRVTTYFSRLHRWVRGDWQLLPWLGRKVKNEQGERVSNPISSVDKWKLFDNLRRSMSPVSTLVSLLLGMCLSGPALSAAAGLAIVSIWSNIFLAGANLAVRGGVGMRRRYHSPVIAGFGGMILQTLVQLLFLPYHAWTCGSAIVVALWRSWVSHRRMLEWVTAADAERKGGGLWENFSIQWPSVMIGSLAIYFARLPVGAAIGAVWMASPIFAWAFSKPVGTSGSTAESDRSFLLHQAALIWGYFRDWVRSEDHWLPPDNVQEKPWLGPARRTSPTNIGMALLSCIAAVDLELTGRDVAVDLISHTLDTIESLPKWNGHLYNWYDTSNCRPLHPRYVSTVDSGNLRACLITLREALYQWGEGELARRAERLSDGMGLELLYDEERKLFAIGFDVEKEERTQGWYDLLASEARLTSYLAVALGEVDPKHWGRLGRGLLGDNNYCGLASWTGTMFEYFMPNLFLPCEDGSLMYESLSFCIYAQKRRGNKTGTPWGISESGFYAFDPGMSYQYKAHGVQALGLKRDLDQELVVAPYASFLALLLAPRSAGRNLRRLRDMGMEGTYGLYEAIDYTPGRIPEGVRMEPVRSFMVHHIGMSLLAIDNALNGNVMQERFLRDCAMGAFRELLQEKVPVGAPIMKLDRQTVQERVRPSRNHTFCLEGDGFCPERPACHLLTNGLVSALCTDSGTVRITTKEGDFPFVTCTGDRYAPAGLCFFYRKENGVVCPLTAAPFYHKGTFHWRFDSSGCKWSALEMGFSASVRFSLPSGERGACWQIEIEQESPGALICYLEPMLATQADYFAHPAYSKLFLESREIEHGVLFSRRPKGGEVRKSLAVRWDRQADGIDTSREVALGRGGLRRLEQALDRPAMRSVGAILDPCLLVRFTLKSKGKHQIKLAMGHGQDEGGAIQTATHILRIKNGIDGSLDGIIAQLRLSEAEVGKVMELLSLLTFPGDWKKETSQSALWPYGVSGDLPIAIVDFNVEGKQTDDILLKAHRFLTMAGVLFDLVYLLEDGGNYLRPQKNALLNTIKSFGMEGSLGKRGGIHLVEKSVSGEEPWSDWATVVIRGGSEFRGRRVSPIEPPFMPCRLLSGNVNWRYGEEEELIFELTGNLPRLGWNHFLVNPHFGWITDETGCGHLWYENARERQITPWNNDPLSIGGPEWFLMTTEGETHSIFGDGDGIPTKVTYGFGWARWEKRWGDCEIKTTALVPWDRNTRLLLVETSKCGELKHVIRRQGETLYAIDKSLCLSTELDGTVIFPADQFFRELQTVTGYWKKMCRPLIVETPEEELNHYLNGWCLYQVIACRLLGRTSRYQNGGAYGFRDQLQDTVALLPFESKWAREQIRRCCAHQFREGDVQHWWHQVGQEKNRGVRTRISDDLLWLPYVLARYVETWGDDGLMEEKIAWLSGEPLAQGERERYFMPPNTEEQGQVYVHARQAIRCVIERGVGEHGLLKVGTGDWNDGMDLVGKEGKGESVWLTWFAVLTLEKFAPLAQKWGDKETEILCGTWAEKLRQAGKGAWNGKWYLRGWYDNGRPLGAERAEECEIDSIAQSWAVLANGKEEKGDLALSAALDKLFDREAGIVKLFTPPFDQGDQEPGYIKGYLPGIRENGGQYTHAAAWLALACFQDGKADKGLELLKALLPAGHTQEIYLAEPYVLAGDVYAHPDHVGRGGWSWYTGAAGWYHQAALQGLLGLTVRGGRLFLEPTLPTGWIGWKGEWNTENGCIQIKVRRGDVRQILLDGRPVRYVELKELTGLHRLELTVF